VNNNAIIEEESGKFQTYGDFYTRVSEIKELLIGIKNLSVAIIIKPSIFYINCFFACVESNQRIIPINIKYPTDRKVHIINDTLPQLIILYKDDPIIDKLDHIYEKVDLQLSNQDNLFLRRKILNKKYEHHGNYFSYVVYTSGSTGFPKGIIGNYEGIRHFIDWEYSLLKDNISDFIIPLLSNISFDASFRDIMLPISTGGTLLIPSEESKLNLMQCLEWFSRHGITLIHTVPSLYRLICKIIKYDKKYYHDLISSLEYIMLAGEQVYGRDINAWKAFNKSTKIVNFYGSTETTLIKSYYVAKNEYYVDYEPISIGSGISDTEVFCISNGIKCSSGESGEITIKTCYATDGYFKNKDLTRKKFLQLSQNNSKEITYKTGDLGIVNDDGSITCIGRIDRQIKVNGIRIEPAEIEKELLSIPSISDTHVVKFADENTKSEMIVCFYIAENEIESCRLRIKLEEKLPQYMIPAHYVAIDKFPFNTNGKIDYKELKNIFNLYKNRIII